jgi:hypothetical protein
VQPGGTLGVTAITWNNFSVGGVYFAGTGLNLSGGDTFNISNTTVAAASYGSASAVPTFTVNAQGQLTAAADANIAIAATQITSGTIDSARLSGTYSGITGVGTLTDLTVSNVITGSISGNAATATTATSATSATTATNIAGGATGSVPYQSAASTTTFLAAGSNGQVLTLASGVPSWATPTTGTVTSVSGTGTVSGISLSGTVTSSGSLTLGGTLDLSSPPTIGNTAPNTGRFTTLTVDDNTTLGSSNTDTVTFNARINSDFEPATDNTYDLGRTGHEWRNLYIDGTANIDSLIADTADINAGSIDGTTIGAASAAAATVTTLNVTSTIALSGSTGTSSYVLTSNGASAPTWEPNANGLAIVDDTTTNATRYLTFTSATTGNITTGNVSSTKLQFNPSTGVLSSTSFTGAATGLTGTASININGTVGATTAATGSFTTLNTSGQVVFNDAGDNVDFRVEGDTNANLLFLDASADAVGIGTNLPSTTNTEGLAFVPGTSSTASIIGSNGSGQLLLGNNGNGSNLAVNDNCGLIAFKGRFNGTFGGGNDIASIVGTYTGDGTTRTGAIRFLTLNAGSEAQRMRIASDGIITMNAYGAGAATFSAAGVISSVSDETWKIKDGVPVDPEAMLKKLEPGYWYYNEEKAPTFGEDRQLGFYAQNVNAAIGPEAAPTPEEGKPWGYYDRSVLAVTVMSLKNALSSIQELKAIIDAQTQAIESLTARVMALEPATPQELNDDGV